MSQLKTTPTQDMAKWTRTVGVYTRVLAVVSIATLAAIAWQSYTAWVAARDTREQLRALMQLTSVPSILTPVVDKPGLWYAFAPSFQNIGGTRTGPLSGWQSINYYPGGVPNNVDFSKPRDAQYTIAKVIVGPNAVTSMLPVSVSSEDVDKALNHEGVIVLWGQITYSDIYSPSSVRTLSFCHQLSPIKNSTPIVAFSVTPVKPECNHNE